MTFYNYTVLEETDDGFKITLFSNKKGMDVKVDFATDTKLINKYKYDLNNSHRHYTFDGKILTSYDNKSYESFEDLTINAMPLWLFEDCLNDDTISPEDIIEKELSQEPTKLDGIVLSKVWIKPNRI